MSNVLFNFFGYVLYLLYVLLLLLFFYLFVVGFFCVCFFNFIFYCFFVAILQPKRSKKGKVKEMLKKKILQRKRRTKHLKKF